MLLVKKDFRKTLKELINNKKDVIDITEKCALEPQHAQAYTEALFEECREAKIDGKLSLLTLVDSLLKNCRKQYQEYLEKGVVEAFCETYIASDDRPEIRKRLKFYYKTWVSYFSYPILSMIELTIKDRIGEDINSVTVAPTKPVKPAVKPKKEEPSLLFIPDDAKRILNREAGERPVKPNPAKPVPSNRPLPPANTSTAAPKRPPSDLPSKRPDTEPKLIKRPEGPPVAKKPEDKIKKKPENGAEHKRPEPVPMLKKPESPLAARKVKEDPPIRKKEMRREKPSIVEEEKAYSQSSKMVKLDQPKHVNMMETAGGSVKPKPKPTTASALPMREQKSDQWRESQAPPSTAKVISDKGPQMMSGFHGGQAPPQRTLQPPPQQRKEPEQRSKYQEPVEEARFSDDEDPSFNPRQPPQGSMSSQYQYQYAQPQNPSMVQQQQQQHHHQYPHLPQNPQFQQQQQQQPHFSGPSRSTQPQYSRPPYQNMSSQPTQSQLQSNLNQGPPQPQFMQHQPQPQPQLQPQIHPSQSHPSHFQPQQSFQSQPLPSGPVQEPELGPNQYQNRPFNPQKQNPAYNQYQPPFQPQVQAQYRPPIHQELQQQQPPVRSNQPDQMSGNGPSTSLLEIRNMFMKQRTERRQGPEQGYEQEYQFVPEIPDPTRKDSFPDPRNLVSVPDVQTYDSSNVLFFRPLLQTLKQELPNAIKSKYSYRAGRYGSLSEMVTRRDFRIVETLYEELPYRCSSCGMRFSSSGLLNKHLDWHFQFNMEHKEKTKTMNLRVQMITTEHWIKDEGHKNFKNQVLDNGEDEFEFENYVLSSEETKTCKACGESFKEVWDKDREAWLLDTATKVKYKEDEGGNEVKQKDVNDDLMHFRCYKLCLQIESK